MSKEYDGQLKAWQQNQRSSNRISETKKNHPKNATDTVKYLVSCIQVPCIRNHHKRHKLSQQRCVVLKPQPFAEILDAVICKSHNSTYLHTYSFADKRLEKKRKTTTTIKEMEEITKVRPAPITRSI
ncbi:hypothetical protein Y032_0022g555 [Ancylostoma ceylanicum]|uniref:Uncharacterized protein n=1 Tax=Ancylostoma ceylanicum TaxID=53326 RepID=A0A016V0M0_9BILA|nr:hypothetical protein Y032_0022g555 [Ancylostoma ceylanicum]